MQGVDGIKTGYTEASGYNLVSSVRRDGRHLVGVVLGERSNGARNARMRHLIEHHLRQTAPTRTPPSIMPAMKDPNSGGPLFTRHHYTLTWVGSNLTFGWFGSVVLLRPRGYVRWRWGDITHSMESLGFWKTTGELEGFRLAKAAPLAVLRRIAAELDKTGLVRMKRQRELPQPVAHRIPEMPSVALMLKTND